MGNFAGHWALTGPPSELNLILLYSASLLDADKAPPFTRFLPETPSALKPSS